jgi:DNA-directed RNA polymerase subunit alpha
MSQTVDVDLKEYVLSGTSFGPQEIGRITDAISADFQQLRTLREAIQQLDQTPERSPATNVRLGVCYYLVGRYDQALETLRQADGGALALFYQGLALFAKQKYDEAEKAYAAAADAGYDADLCTLKRVEARRYGGDPEGALKILDSLSGAVEQTAEYLSQRACTVAALGGNPSEVVALFERAVEADGRHAGALFGLALENDRRGNDAEAQRLYERAVSRFPQHVGSTLNLGILYEDRNQFDKARACYRRILDVFPDHPRARLFYKDAEASGDMYYDEDAQRRKDRLSQVLSIPVTDFELSVRSRNCLQKMGIGTLGDLASTSEQELLGSKNFGETSLSEIRDMLASKGLSLGQFADDRPMPEPVYRVEHLSPDEQAFLSRPIAELNLSVRARKCMVRLGITTIGELVRRTGDELLECKNFGVTSLNEVREKLGPHGLKLRGD